MLSPPPGARSCTKQNTEKGENLIFCLDKPEQPGRDDEEPEAGVDVPTAPELKPISQ